MKNIQFFAIALLLTLVLFSHSKLSAQWLQSATTIYPSTLTKNVGIGTNSPISRFQVYAPAAPSNALVNFGDSEGRRIIFVPKLGNSAYNDISRMNDAGIFWSDNGVFNTSAGFVIAPHKNSLSGMRIDPNGNIGIGINNPTARLDIVGGPCWSSYCWKKALQVDNASALSFRVSPSLSYGIGASAGDNSLYFFTASDGAVTPPAYRMVLTQNGGFGVSSRLYPGMMGTEGGYSLVHFKNGTSTTGGIVRASIGSSDYGDAPLGFQSSRIDISTGGVNRMSITNDGKVGIGINNSAQMPGNYKLYVADGILTEKVRVALKSTSDWADYVFANDYKLWSLTEVETYIRENKHLPGVPSAEEVQKTGIDMAAMDAKLLEKIEELTLYVIGIQKENEVLKARISALESIKK